MVAPLVPRDLLRALRLGSWRSFFEGFGHPAGIPVAVRTIDAVGDAIDPPARAGEDPPAHPPALLVALASLRALAHPRGRRAVFAAARAEGLDVSRWPAQANDAELAVFVLLEARKRKRTARVVQAALSDLRQRERPRPFRLYLGRSREGHAVARAPLPPSEERLAALVSALAAHARAERRRFRVGLRVCADPHAPGTLVVEVSRELMTGAPDPLVTIDLVRYDAPRDRLGIRTDDPALLPVIRRAMGVVLWNDEAHFGTEPVVDLRALQERGAALFDVTGATGVVAKARVIRVWRDVGRRLNWKVRGPNVLEELARDGVSLSAGVLPAVTLRLELSRGEPRSVDAFLRIPNRVAYDPGGQEGLLDDVLEAAGTVKRRSAVAASGAALSRKRDLWSLAPFVHKREVFDEVLGVVVSDAFVAAGVLVPSESRAVAHPDHPHAGRPLIVFRLPDGSHYGVSEDEDVPPAFLPADALATWELDLAAFGGVVARAMGLEGEPRELAHAGLLELGFRQLDPTRVHVFLAAAKPDLRSANELLAALGSPGRAVVLVPAGRVAHVAAPEIPFAPAGPYEGLLRDVILKLRLEDEADALLFAPRDAELVVDARRDRAWLYGVLLDLHPSHRAMLTALARARGAAVTNEDLARAVGSGHRDGRSVPEQKMRLVAAVRACLVAAGRNVPEPLPGFIEAVGRKQGYRLVVRAFLR